MESKKDTFTVHNKISNNFRELHVDGAYGGITPKGFININFYAERMAIPKATEFKIENKEVKRLGDSLDSKTGVVREFEIGVYMNIETAQQFHKWLGEHISKSLQNTKQLKDDDTSL